MLSKDDLKAWLHRGNLKALDKLLLTLSSFDTPCQVMDLNDRAKAAGFGIPRGWNPSAILGRSQGLAIRTPEGWEITEAGKQHLRNLGVTKASPAAVQVATELRAELLKIKDDDTRAFVEEAIKCYENDFHRSAVVMSWLAAVHVLYRHVHRHHLAAFNVEAKRVDAKWKPAKTIDDMGRMKEQEFLDRVSALSIIGKNVKEELLHCLKRRNGCGHPNSMKISTNTVASHLEILLLNVFRVFQ